MNEQERVLCFNASLLDEMGRFQGVLSNQGLVVQYCARLLDGRNLFYVERRIAESDPALKQVIPYTLLRRDKHVFCYQRTKKGGENRLHDKWSIGVGGHVNPEDGEPGAVAYETAFWRELKEEVSLGITTQAVIGLINDDTDDVGKVHFGIVHEIQVGFAVLSFKDPAIGSGCFLPPDGHKKLISRYENWSQLIIDKLL